MLADTLFTYGHHLQKNQVNLVEYHDEQLVEVRQTSMEYWFFTQEQICILMKSGLFLDPIFYVKDFNS